MSIYTLIDGTSCDLSRVVRHKPNLVELEVLQDRAAESVATMVGLESELVICFHRIVSGILELVASSLFISPIPRPSAS